MTMPGSVLFLMFFPDMVLKVLVKKCANSYDVVPVQCFSCWCSMSRRSRSIGLGSPKSSHHINLEQITC